MALEQVIVVVPIAAGVVTAVMMAVMYPRMKASKARTLRAAARLKPVEADDVPKDQVARSPSMVQILAVASMGLLLAAMVCAIDDYRLGKWMRSKTLMTGATVSVLWAIAVSVVGRCLTGRDLCPQCGRVTVYYRADWGKFTSCRVCKRIWKAGKVPA